MTISVSPNPKHQVSNARTWGCLAVGVILSGAFFVILFEGIGGTEYELK
jgi:hypothetical protein